MDNQDSGEDESGPPKKEEVVFYYSREHRLERASSTVREFNEGHTSGPVKSLVGRRSNLLLLVSILIVCVMFILTSRTTGAEKGFKLGGNQVVFSITAGAEGKNTAALQKAIPAEGEFYTGAVEIAVSPVLSKQDQDAGKTPEVYTEKLFFTFMDREDYRFELPFEGVDFFVLLQTENERKSLRIKVKNE